MIKPFPLKVTVIVLIFFIILTVLFLPGCAKEKIVIHQELDTLSLGNIWGKLVDATGVQNEAVELDNLRLHADANGNVDSLSLVFRGTNNQGKTKVYFASMNSKNELNWHSDEGEFTFPVRDPMNIFTEIDNIGLSSLETGDSGLLMQIDFMSGDIGYSYDYADIYHLENGNLRQLEKLVFHSRYPWCSISVHRLFPNETAVTENGQSISKVAVTVTGPVPPGERTSQIWFLSEDVNMAETVQYLED